MNTNYEITVTLRTPDGIDIQHRVNVDAFRFPVLDPYDLCDRGIDAMIFNGKTMEMAARIDKDRASLLQDVGMRIASSLLDMVKSRDKRNGYTKEDLASEEPEPIPE